MAASQDAVESTQQADMQAQHYLGRDSGTTLRYDDADWPTIGWMTDHSLSLRGKTMPQKEDERERKDFSLCYAIVYYCKI